MPDETTSSADIFRPVFQISLEVRHEFTRVGAVHDPVIEAEREPLNGANCNRVIAVLVRQHLGFLIESADPEDSRLRLVDDRRAELLAEDAGVGQRECAS